jgi:hypothetical protein
MRDGSYAAFPVLVFTPLCLREIARSPHALSRPRIGFLAIAVALGWQYVCVNAGWPRFGRPAIALAIAGLSLWLGQGAGRSALMALFAVPVPSRVLELAADRASTLLLSPALTALRAIGSEVEFTRNGIIAAGASMEWLPADVGLGFAVFAAGLGCHACAADASARVVLVASGRAFVLGAVAAALAANAAVILVGTASAVDLAWIVLRLLPWLLAIALAIRHSSAAAPLTQARAA